MNDYHEAQIMMEWKYYDPKFEYEEIFDDLDSPWAGHKYFAYDLVRNLKLQKIVALGTKKGTPFFSFCQAVKDGELGVELTIIDFRKSENRDGYKNGSVYEKFKRIRDTYYSNLKINILETAIDKALADFPNNSIDILHLDGSLIYEGAKSNFICWVDRVKDGGIILFQETESQMDLGVPELWEELKKKYKTIEFAHSQGLGILFKNQNNYNDFFDFQYIWQCYYPLTAKNKILRFDLKNKNQEIMSLEQTVRQKEYDIENYKPVIVDLLNQVDDLETKLKTIHNSNGWKLICWYYRAWDKLLPGNTERRLRFREKIRKFVKVILAPSREKNT